MFRFALKTLAADRGKLFLALVGVIFSLVLINIQGGLFLGMIRKASLLVDHTRADIWIGHRGLENVDMPHEIPEAWLDRLKGMSGVERAEPYIVAPAPMTLPNGEYEQIWIVGSERPLMLGTAWSFAEGSHEDLLRPDAIAVDELDDWKLGAPRVGDVVEIHGRRAKIVAKTRGILGFLTTPYVFATLDSARRYARMPPGHCSYFLIQADPGADLQDLCRRIRQRVPELDVYTSEELSLKSRVYWMLRTGLGQSFGGATVLGLIVGLVMVAQSLYALVLDHLSDFAALKAIGAEDRHVLSVVVSQAVAIAGGGIVLGSLAAYVLQWLISTPYTPVEIPPWLWGVGVGLVFLLCLGSSILPYQRLRRVDPAVVLQN